MRPRFDVGCKQTSTLPVTRNIDGSPDSRPALMGAPQPRAPNALIRVERFRHAGNELPVLLEKLTAH